MIFDNNKFAFSLTELLIVIVVIAFVFAAMAPIVTKRKMNEGNYNSEHVWNYVTGDSNLDAYYDPGPDNWASIAYIGLMTPYDNDLKTHRSHGGKLTIKANPANDSLERQRHIQFRFGLDKGIYAGSFAADNSNMILGSGYDEAFKDSENNVNNTVLGLNSGRVTKMDNSTAKIDNSTLIGNYVLFEPKIDKISSLTAVGANSSKITSDINSTYVGSNSGINTSGSQVESNVGVGYNSLNSDRTGTHNTAVGANTGNSLSLGSNNVIAASQAGITSGSDNTIVGYGAYGGGNGESSGITAIGFGACSSFKDEEKTPFKNKTCIGYGSGGAKNATDGFGDDDSERIYIGGLPKGGFAGRAVLEVHNLDGNNGSVVLNSNLVLRGELFTSGGGNTVYKRHTKGVTQGILDWQCSSETMFFGRYICLMSSQAKSPSNSFLDIYAQATGNYMNLNNNDGFPNLSSDIRLKENISENNDGLTKLLQLKPFNYTFKSDDKKIAQVGVIAQDLMKVFPNAVSKAKDGYYSIRWDEMFYALVNSIKTLNAKIEQIALDITNMQKDVKSIENSNKTLKKRVADLNARAAKLEKNNGANNK